MDRDDVKYAVVIGVLAAALYIGAHLTLSGCRMEQAAPPKQMEAAAEANHPEIPEGSAAKVAAVMAAEGITLPQVASYLNTYGYDVVSRANTLRPHWSPAPPGRDAQGNVVPVAYYVANVRIAVGDTTIAIYAPQAVGPIWMRVKAYDGRGMSGDWSATEVSGPGALLPGVAE